MDIDSYFSLYFLFWRHVRPKVIFSEMIYSTFMFFTHIFLVILLHHIKILKLCDLGFYLGLPDRSWVPPAAQSYGLAGLLLTTISTAEPSDCCCCPREPLDICGLYFWHCNSTVWKCLKSSNRLGEYKFGRIYLFFLLKRCIIHLINLFHSATFPSSISQFKYCSLRKRCLNGL